MSPTLRRIPYNVPRKRRYLWVFVILTHAKPGSSTGTACHGSECSTRPDVQKIKIFHQFLAVELKIITIFLAVCLFVAIKSVNSSPFFLYYLSKLRLNFHKNLQQFFSEKYIFKSQ